MNTTAGTFAKTTRPSPADVAPRERLYARLEQALRQPLVWLVGPPGSGKTTLIADYIERRRGDTLWYHVDPGDADIATFFYYLGQSSRRDDQLPLPVLSPEYRGDVGTFTRSFFREFFARTTPPFALVLDNYEEVPADAILHDVLANCVQEAPAGVRVMVLSRTEPPASLARLRANQLMQVIDWPELRLTRPEHDAIIALRRSDLEPAAFTRLYERTQGWAAGLVLLLGDASLSLTGDVTPLTPSLVFDYLDTEVFAKLDAPTRDLLLRTAPLPRLTQTAIAELCPRQDVSRVLTRLGRNYFLMVPLHGQSEPTFAYHPLVREFLTRKAEEVFTSEELLDLRRRAARRLERELQPDEAAHLLVAARDWPALIELIRSSAIHMLAQGRGETLVRWIRALPAEALVQDPWLYYWLGSARFPYAPREAFSYFEQAYRLFSHAPEPMLEGRVLALAGMMETLLNDPDVLSRLDPLIDEAERVYEQCAPLKGTTADTALVKNVFMSLVLRQPQHPRINTWGERALALAEAPSTDPNLRVSINLYLATSLMWKGQFGRAAKIIDTMRALAEQPVISPLSITSLRHVEAMYHMLLGQQDPCLEAVYDGLDIVRSSGVQVWNNTLLVSGLGAALGNGDLEAAGELLKELRGRPLGTRRFDLCLFEYCSGWYALLRGDAFEAYRHVRESVRLAEEVGAPFFQTVCGLGLSQVLAASGDHAGAAAELERVAAMSKVVRSRLLEFMVLMCAAQDHFRRGDIGQGRAVLQAALVLGRERGLTHVLFWQPAQIAELCAHALQAGIESAYVRSLIQMRNLYPAQPPYHVREWPWAYRVTTFGQFQLEAPTRVAESSGRAQRRPLELLKALIALGGRNVPLERLADALWPRIDSDYAHRSLTTTLHRLRRLLGDDAAITLQEGQLSLSAHRFWTDTWAFDRLLAELARVRAAGADDAGSRLQQLTEQLFDLYRGPFLGQERDDDWAIAPREHWHARFLRSVSELAQHAERSGDAERAVQLYRRALDVDPLAEGLYRGLMECCQRADRCGEAVDAYERCRQAFKTARRGEPAAETQSVYQSVVKRYRVPAT